MKHGLDSLDRAKLHFMEKIAPDPNSGCWLWTAHVSEQGYARMMVDRRAKSAHRFSYEQFVGPIPSGLTIDHRCRVRCCVNPNHLEAVSFRENIDRAIATRTHCKRGHPYTPENVISTPKINRVCRQCTLVSTRRAKKAYRQRHKKL